MSVSLPAPAPNLPLPWSCLQQRSLEKVDPGLSVVQPLLDKVLLVDSLHWGHDGRDPTKPCQSVLACSPHPLARSRPLQRHSVRQTNKGTKKKPLHGPMLSMHPKHQTRAMAAEAETEADEAINMQVDKAPNSDMESSCDFCMGRRPTGLHRQDAQWSWSWWWW